MKNLIIKMLVALGFLSLFKGTTDSFEVYAAEGSEKSAARSEHIGGRSGGCGKSG